MVSMDGIYISLGKVRAVLNWEHLTSVTEMWSLFGLTGYNHCFVEGFSMIAVPLYYLIQKGVKFEWMDICEQSFLELKKRLKSTSVLA